jgi:hypothetical protein
MIIDLTPKTYSELYQLFNPHANNIHDEEAFKRFVQENYKATLSQEYRPDANWTLGWTAEFDDWIDLIDFCNKFDI